MKLYSLSALLLVFAAPCTRAQAPGTATDSADNLPHTSAISGKFSAEQSDRTGGYFPLRDFRVTGGNPNCDPAQFFHNVQYKWNFTAAVAATTCDTTDTTSAFQTVGLHATATTLHPGTTAVAGNFYGFSLANGTKAFALNPVWQDVAGLTSGVAGVVEEADWQPYNPPSAYTYSAIYHAALVNNKGNNGTYPVTAFMMSSHNNLKGSAAFFKYGINVIAGALGPASVLFNVNPMGFASPNRSYSSPLLETAYGQYWDTATGAGQYESFDRQFVLPAGSDPAWDTYLFTHHCNAKSGCPSGQIHLLAVDSTSSLGIQHADHQTFSYFTADPGVTGNVALQMPSFSGQVAAFATPPSAACSVVADPTGKLSCGSGSTSGGTSPASGVASTFVTTTSGFASFTLSNGFAYATAPTCTATPQNNPIFAACKTTLRAGTVRVSIKATGDDTFNVQIVPVTQ